MLSLSIGLRRDGGTWEGKGRGGRSEEWKRRRVGGGDGKGRVISVHTCLG